MEDLNKPTKLCPCVADWIRKLACDETGAIAPDRCSVCNKRHPKETPLACGTIIVLCAAKPGRVHACPIGLCPEGDCTSKFNRDVLDNPIRVGFFAWMPGHVSGPDRLEIVKKASGVLGTLVGVTCDNKQCGNHQTSTSPKLKRCNGCHKVAYCGKECQRQAWKDGHKLMCKALNGTATKEEMKELVDSGRVLSKIKTPAEKPRPIETPCPCFDDVDTHRFNAQENHTCSNPGCFKPVVGVGEFGMNIVDCRNSPDKRSTGKFHIFGTHYCGIKCQKASVKQ